MLWLYHLQPFNPSGSLRILILWCYHGDKHYSKDTDQSELLQVFMVCMVCWPLNATQCSPWKRSLISGQDTRYHMSLKLCSAHEYNGATIIEFFSLWKWYSQTKEIMISWSENITTNPSSWFRIVTFLSPSPHPSLPPSFLQLIYLKTVTLKIKR